MRDHYYATQGALHIKYNLITSHNYLSHLVIYKLMLLPILLLSAVIVCNVLIQVYGTVWWLSWISRTFKRKNISQFSGIAIRLLSISFIFFSFLHAFQTIIWALLYLYFPESSIAFDSFSDAWYFSLVTFTSLGYGDIVLSGHWRLISGIEAINGIMLIGWSTALMFLLVQRFFKMVHDNQHNQ